MTEFTTLGIPQAFVEMLKQMKITIPTPVQKAAIPVALEGKDIFATAQTGSGKTIAYLIPLLIKLTSEPSSCGLILTPTRELATQVFDLIHSLLGQSPRFQTALIIGGTSMSMQFSALKRQPRLIVGTPGRINDHLVRKSIKLHDTRFLIVDEADRMLDMGFGVQLDQIVKHLPASRQTLMFSATLPINIEKLSKKHLSNPQRIGIESSSLSAPKIKQEVIRTTNAEKFPQLLQQLQQREGSILIFSRTRRGADRLSRELNDQGHKTRAIHGDLVQRKRDSVIQAFRNGSIRILVATDIAARGIDISHIMHVINYDLPQCPEDYIHRIGRTARAGAEGFALSFVTSGDNQKWKAISRLFQPESSSSRDSQDAKFDQDHHARRRSPGRPFFKKGSSYSSKGKRGRY